MKAENNKNLRVDDNPYEYQVKIDTVERRAQALS